jgi:hypothetical protein
MARKKVSIDHHCGRPGAILSQRLTKTHRRDLFLYLYPSLAPRPVTYAIPHFHPLSDKKEAGARPINPSCLSAPLCDALHIQQPG